MLAIDSASSLVPVVVTSADFAGTGHPYLSFAPQPLQAAASYPPNQALQLLSAQGQPLIPQTVNYGTHVTGALKVSHCSMCLY